MINSLWRFGLLERMPVITHNTLNAAAQPIERDTSTNEGFTTENKSEITNLLGDLETPLLPEQAVLYFVIFLVLQ